MIDPCAETSREPRYSRAQRLGAAGLGVVCHGCFAIAIAAMILGLDRGLTIGRGALHGAAAWLANTGLALQFPVLHSALLTPRGQRWLVRVVPGRLGRELRTTSYALLASLQILATFALWSPSGAVWWSASAVAPGASRLAFAAAWLLVGKAMLDAGLDLQSGFLGWGAVVRNRAPSYRAFPQHGLFRFTRQPVYVAFTLTLWTAPVITPDRLLLGGLWTLYCVVGPRLKERRYLARHPTAYRRFQARVPYWVPRLPFPGLEG